VLAKQVTEPAPPLSSLGLAVPRKLASLVDRCLAKDPVHRPENAHALAEQLGVALEQRREMPAALRAFVKRYGRLDGGGTLIAGFALLPVSVAVSAYLGVGAGFTTFVLGLTVAPLSYLVRAARRLSLLGFRHRDVAPAFKAEIEQAREELTVEQRSAPHRLETIVRRVGKVSAAVFGVSFAAFLVRFGLPLPIQVFRTLGYIDQFWPFAVGMGTLSVLGLLALAQRHRDVDAEFWARVWQGRIGKLAFSIARKLLGNRSRESAMTHRATELSLGMAAEQLYESLPKEHRLALHDLPALLKRLQDDAQSLRKRYDDIQEALGAAGDASSPEYADIRAVRDEAHAKLAEAVGALETIRLNLLRLHAGSATVEGVTTHLGLAADVSEEVERLIAAHDDVERILRFPRPPVVSPV
jgi:serine/threonine-protein kinase